MNRELFSGQPRELKYLAETHGASVEEVEEVIAWLKAAHAG